ncbi:HipA family kinase [Propionibacteriaceae bacterium Y2011]|uniref:HipA family kinase n=1 Tax=Microlunatus sp. Y2014 TaxID=3418488 RepID=UPI003B4EFC44
MSPPGPVISPLATVRALTYLTPLREGGSLPGLVEADDLGTHVVKFTGAGQGPRALVAEIIVGSLARLLDIPTPELKLIVVDDELGRRDPDEEVNDLITASAGLNLASDFLPGAIGYDRGIPMEVATASRIVWLDALCANVDRSERNTNLLLWGGKVWAIDHGACLGFHHSWSRAGSYVRAPYRYDDHVLADVGAPQLVHAELAPRVTAEALDEITALVPDAWLEPDPTRPDPAAPADAAAARIAYRDTILSRLDAAQGWLR